MNLNGIRFGLSKAIDGSMGRVWEDENKANRLRFFKRNKIDQKNIFSAQLVHSNNVKKVTRRNKKILYKTDGLYTNEKNVALTITVADCLPVFFYNPERRVIGLAHAGWKGLKSNILKKMLLGIKKDLRVNAKDLLVYIGPHIRVCHYEVRSDLIKVFRRYKKAVVKKDAKFYVNLSSIAKTQLQNLGIFSQNITISRSCVYENKNYFSYRRNKSKKLHTMLAYIYFD